jgi:hypothetical protein
MFPVSVATVVSVSVFPSNLNVALIILRTSVIYKLTTKSGFVHMEKVLESLPS